MHPLGGLPAAGRQVPFAPKKSLVLMMCCLVSV